MAKMTKRVVLPLIAGKVGDWNSRSSTYQPIEDETALKAAIASLKKRGDDVQKYAHRVACSVLLHVAKHHNINIVSHLMENFPSAMRANALRRWFECFGPVKFDGNDPKYVKGKQVQLAEAMSKPFWKFRAAEGQPYAPLDVDTAIIRLVKQLKADTAKAAEVGQTVTHTEEISTLVKLIKNPEKRKAA